MGGDCGPAVVVPAVLDVLKRHPNLHLILTGDERAIAEAVRASAGRTSDRLAIRHASQRVEMHEPPSQALRNKKDSSMRVAIDLVKDDMANACVSAGNTGALMATARFVLKTLPGMDRPAICNKMPGIAGQSHLLDLGANVNSSPKQLFQFGVMGSVLTTAVDNTERPTVALLNIGEEAIKGNERVRQAAELLAASDLNYVGFVEGDDIYKGEVDVIVCDGFIGNVALKASEGAAQMLAHFAKEEFSRSIFTRMMATISSPILKALKQRTDPRFYNGASLLGLRGTVVKSHGSADRFSFAQALEEAIKEIEKAVPHKISEHLQAILSNREAV